ncbi:MAG: hypothetical protein J6T74_07150 [Clostridia bacterium]|nr:hypothetical protein [Clostridia bacterium]
MTGPQFFSGSPECTYDEEIDGKLENPIVFNVNGESYVSLFKRHKEEKERR